LQANYVTVFEDRPILYAEYIVFHFWPQLTHPAARSLCDSWATSWCWDEDTVCRLGDG